MGLPLHVALVGYGLAGKAFHAPLISATEGLTLTTVVSSDSPKVHADWPEVQVVPDLESALRNPAIDLVVIATPNMLHAAQALAALDADKHVVIDKPFATTIAEATQVAAMAKVTGRQLAIFHNRRWDSDYLTLKALIDNGSLGEIVQFESHFDRYRPVVRDRWKEKAGAGIWPDLGPHLVDQALTLFGMPEAVSADIGIQRVGGQAPDYAHVLLRYPRLRVILHATQSIHAHGLRYAVHGTKGSFIKYGLDPQEDQSKAGLKPGDADWGVDAQPGTLTYVDPQDVAHSRLIENVRGDYPAFYRGVRDCILGVAANPVPAAQALDVMTVLDASLTSAMQGREIRLG